MNNHIELEGPRPCERRCKSCKEWKHHSRYHVKVGNSTIAKYFDSVCRDCRQRERNEKKNADRPLAIIRNRASVAARKAGTTTDFFMVQMNYRALVPLMRALMSEEGLCLGCGHAFVNERDIHIDHIAPPRNPKDWARLHARNLRLTCGSCNGTKSDKKHTDWLDEQEGARISNLVLQSKASENQGDGYISRSGEFISTADPQSELFSESDQEPESAPFHGGFQTSLNFDD